MTTPGKRIASVAPNKRNAETIQGAEDRDRSECACVGVIASISTVRAELFKALYLFLPASVRRRNGLGYADLRFDKPKAERSDVDDGD